jgi:fluoride exporter
MMKIILVLTGGAVGSLLRYIVSESMSKVSDGGFPYGTLFVNLCGCLIIGLLWGIFSQEGLTTNVKAFLFIGLLGGFTTFSAFALESFQLFDNGQLKTGVIYILISNIAGISLTIGGYYISRLMMKIA